MYVSTYVSPNAAMTKICLSFLKFTPTSLANATLIDPQITITQGDNLTFTLSALGGVAPWTWLDHPSGTFGVFVDNATGVPSNGFYLVPGIDRTGELHRWYGNVYMH